MEKILIIYAERPVAGHVKEHLAMEIGEEEASGLYARILFELLIKLIENDLENTQLEVWGLSPGDVPFFCEAFPEIRTRLQIGDGFGDRLATTFEKSFRAQANYVVIIKADIPCIDTSIISKAFDSLSKSAVVIGPTNNEDIYLIGMTSPGVPIFHGINGENERILPQILDNLREYEIDYALLDELNCLENLEDVNNWRRDQFI